MQSSVKLGQIDPNLSLNERISKLSSSESQALREALIEQFKKKELTELEKKKFVITFRLLTFTFLPKPQRLEQSMLTALDSHLHDKSDGGKGKT
ncbi:MAG: hypothetical protein ACK5P7_01875 [Bdellovibrio sp.]|jgi:hypothetical protein